MSKLVVVGVKDLAVQAFGRPIFVPALGAAIRSFADEVNRKDGANDMNKHPADFEMWLLGYFDEASGEFENELRLVTRGVDAKIVEV